MRPRLPLFWTAGLLGLCLGVGTALWGPARAVAPAELATARAALSAGDYDRAISTYTTLLQAERPGAALLATIYRERGTARQKSGALAHAIADYTNAIWLEALPTPLLARTFLARGVAHLELSQWSRAVNDFDAAVARDPSLADAYFGRASAKRLRGDPAQALADYEEALKRGHAHPELVRFGRGLAYEALGDRRRALDDYRQASLLAPTYQPARAKIEALGGLVPTPAEAGVAGIEAQRRAALARERAFPQTEVAVADAGDVLSIEGALGEATGALPPPSAEVPGQPADTAVAEASPAGDEKHDGTGGAPGGLLLRPSSDGRLALGGPASLPQAEARGAIAAPAVPKAPTVEAPAPPEPPRVAALAAEPTDAASGAPAAPEEAAVAAAVAGAGPRAGSPGAFKSGAPAPGGPSGGYFIQLGAWSQRATAEGNLARVKAQFPAETARAAPTLVSAELAGKGPIHRLRLGPIASEEAARSLCAELVAKGQACVLATR